MSTCPIFVNASAIRIFIPEEILNRTDLPPAAKALYGFFLHYRARFPQVFTSHKRLAQDIGQCVSSVKNHIQKLCACGLLRKITHGVKRSNSYELPLEDAKATPPEPPSPRAARAEKAVQAQELPPIRSQPLALNKGSKTRSRSNLGSVIARARCGEDEEKNQLAKEIVEIRRELANLGESAAIVNPGAYRHTLAKRDLDSLKQDLEHNRTQLAAVKAARTRRIEPGEYVAPEPSATDLAWASLPESERAHWLAQAQEAMRKTGYLDQLHEHYSYRDDFTEFVAVVIETTAKELFQAADQVDPKHLQLELQVKRQLNERNEIKQGEEVHAPHFQNARHSDGKLNPVTDRKTPLFGSETNLVVGECGGVFEPGALELYVE
jgi:hypothetical protein